MTPYDIPKVALIDGKKVIAHYKCAIDNEDMSDGCKPGLCNYYKREKESEVK